MSPLAPAVSFAKFKPLVVLVTLICLSPEPIDNLSLTFAEVTSRSFAKAKVTSLPSRLTFKFLPAFKVKVSPALRASFVPLSVSSPTSSVVFCTFTKVDASLIALATSFTVATDLSALLASFTVTLPRSAAGAPAVVASVVTSLNSPLVTEAPFVASTVNTLLASVLVLSLIVLSVFSRPLPASTFATSTVTVCLPV